MTRINKMVMHGFKSFAKKTEILFGGDFNCVLGPNGSGKSNVLDSLCFVLGRSSSKSLRAEKSANLIYNGGKSKNPAKHGEVSIYFDNKSKIFPFDTEEVKITRIVKGNGSSLYKINDAKKTRQEVLDMLGLARINPNGHNIVLQGDIIRFVEMSPLERRKVIEEISGISAYEEKKDKAVKELSKVEEKLKEADIILTERGTYLKELKKERDQALHYKNLSEQISANKATYAYLRLNRRKEKSGELSAKIEGYKSKLDKCNEEIKQIRSQITGYKEKISSINKEIEEKGEKEQVAVHKQVEDLKIKIATATTRLDNLKNEILKINERKKKLNDNIKENDKLFKDLDSKLKSLEKELLKNQAEQKQICQKIESFRKKHKIDSEDNIIKEIEKIDKAIEEKEKEVHEVREKQQGFLREKDRLEYQIETIDDKIRKVKEVERENKDKISELKNKKQEFKKSIVDLNKCLSEDSAFAARIASNRKKLVQAQEELSKLKARNITVQESIAGNIAIKRILEQKNNINGIYGTVAQLGRVNSKYSLALEIAAGKRIDSIVVESDAVASRCIKYLKEKRLGVAAFIPLNKIRTPQRNAVVDSLKRDPGVHDLAINLVSFEPKFKKVFEHVFGDTMVVSNIETARKIGISKARMVTLDGDLAEMSGVMRGGFRARKAKGIGFQEKEVVKDIEAKESIIAQLQATIPVVESKRKENEENIVRLRQFKAELEGEIIKMEKSLHLEEGDLNASKNKKQELSSRLKEVDKEMTTVNLKVSSINRALAQDKIRKQQLRADINQLKRPTLVAELNAFEEKKRELRDRSIQIESEIKNTNLQLNMFKTEQEKINSIIKQHDKEISAFTAEKSDMHGKVGAWEKDLKEKERHEKEFYAKFKELFNRRTQIGEDIQKLESKIDGINETGRKTEISMNTFSLEHARVLAELAGIEEEFKQYEGVKLLKDKPEDALKRDINKFERLVDQMEAVNMKALEIYETVEKEYAKLTEKKENLGNERLNVLNLIDEIEDKKKELFLKTLNTVNENFKRIFSALSTKGQASLVLENPKDPLAEGLKVMVRLTGKKYMDIRSLSGGEKTMTALAFIFAVQEHEPHSFYVLDEVDAALDKHNSEKLAKLIRQYVDRAQYIVINHNDSLISEADNLYGVSMNEHGITNLTSLKI